MVHTSLLLVLLIGSGENLEKTIRAQNNKVIKALTSGDAKAYAELFTEDGFVMTPGSPTIRGKENIFSSRRDVLARVKVTSARLDTISLERNGAVAWEMGLFTYEFRGENGEKRVVTGKYLVLWEQQADGTWKIQGDVGLPDP